MPAQTNVALCAALPLPVALTGAATAPDAIHLVPAGPLTTVDGRGPYRMTDAAAVAASFKPGDRLPLDENHATDLAAPLGGSSPARGWIVGLQARDDGLWGQVEWTGEGRKLVEDRAYRHISPAILHTEDGEIVGIARASLVNLANLKGLTALHQQRPGPMNFIQQMRAALGLPDTADEAAVLAAATAATARLSTHGAIAKAVGVAEAAEPQVVLQAVQTAAGASRAALAPINKALGLAETADAAVALQAVQALKDPAQNVPAATVVALQSQLSSLTQSVSKERAEAFVDAQIKAGKVGLKPLRDHYVARHMADPAAVEKELGAMVALQAQRPLREPKEGEPALDEADEAVIALMGVDPKAFAKTREAETKRI